MGVGTFRCFRYREGCLYPASPVFPCPEPFFCPHPPDPRSQSALPTPGKGETSALFCRGGFAPGTPASESTWRCFKGRPLQPQPALEAARHTGRFAVPGHLALAPLQLRRQQKPPGILPPQKSLAFYRRVWYNEMRVYTRKRVSTYMRT